MGKPLKHSKPSKSYWSKRLFTPKAKGQDKIAKDLYGKCLFHEEVHVPGSLLYKPILGLDKSVIELTLRNHSASNYGNDKISAAFDSLKESDDLEYATNKEARS